MPNHLAGETSPYLLQHAGNPVDWYPWGEEALGLARGEGKPILLSIGYSACHWCHVMAHESFEDLRVAAAMNANFVNIKVDREERPDLDQIYQTAHALLTRRSGGWPLTMFLTPAGAPFFGGTYFPKEGRYGLPGFLELLPRVAASYHEQGSAIAEQGAQLREALAELEPVPRGADALPPFAREAILAELRQRFDSVHGGFGAAPKFPRATDLEFCMREYARTKDTGALAMVHITLERMADGGIHDQLGGGFCRYSVDAQWTIPHFEKMLYDNAPLLGLYADLARVTGDSRFANVARGIVGWMTREMRAADGAFFSSLDADSGGHEGRFYVWTRDDYAFLLAALLELLQSRFRAEDYAWARELADVLLEEFEDPADGGFFFTSHDHEALFHRTKPGHDNATPSGNGVAAGALIVLGHLCSEPRYVEAGERAVRLYSSALTGSPVGYATMLTALADLQHPPEFVLLAGDPGICREWQRALERNLRPSVRIFDVACIPLPPELAKGPVPTAGAVAWICRGTQCLPPVHSLTEIELGLLG